MLKTHKLYKIFIYVFLVLVNINLLHAQTADLTILNTSVSNLPGGAVVSWHTATPATNVNEITTGNAVADATAVPADATYYMAFKDTGNNCYSPTVAVPVLENSCLNTGADLTSLNTSETNNPGNGVTLSFHTSVITSAGNLVNDPSSVSEGIYYAAFFDSANNCYSANTTPVLVVNNNCDADLSLLIKVNKATPKVGENIIYTLEIRNDGPYTATGVHVKDALPIDKLALVSDDATINSTTYSNNIWNVGTVNVGQVIRLRLVVRITGTGLIVNKAEIVQSNQPDTDSIPNNDN